MQKKDIYILTVNPAIQLNKIIFQCKFFMVNSLNHGDNIQKSPSLLTFLNNSTILHI